MGIMRPKLYYKSVFEINYSLLKEKNIKVLIFDLDNTIVLTSEDEPSDKIKDLFSKLNNEFKVFIASNNHKERVRSIGKALGVHAFYLVKKPSKKIKKLLLQKCTVAMNEVVIIGDQVVTDIFMGNRLGAYTVLVDPMGKDLKRTFLNRTMERIILKIIRLKRGNYYEQIL